MTAKRKSYTYQVVTTNGHGVFGPAHKSFGKAREAAVRIAADWTLPNTLFEVERIEHVDMSGRRYYLRRGKRWVMWPCPDATVRMPDFFVISAGRP